MVLRGLGGVNGLYQVIEECFGKIFRRINKILKLNRDSFDCKIVHGIITYLLIDFTWLFFRADSVSDAVRILRFILENWKFKRLLTNNVLNIFGNTQNVMVIGISIGLLLFVDILREKGYKFSKYILESNLLFKWGIILFMLLFIVVFGAYGGDNGQTQFIYFQF